MVMSYLFNIAYLLVLIVISPWIVWRSVTTGRYREGLAAKLLGHVPVRRGNSPCVWLHAVSVGEINLLGTLIDEITRRHPDWECVVSTTTRTGYALARRKFAHLSVFHCPLDFSWAVRRAMRRIRPDLLVLAELELWPNLVRATEEIGAQAAVVNGRLSERSFHRYRWVRLLLTSLFEQLDLIAVQDETYAQRFRDLGVDPRKIAVTGSMKYDGARGDRRNSTTVRLARLAGFKPDDIVFLAGSTQEPEEYLAIDTFLALRGDHPRLRLVLAPRHPERFESVARLLDAVGIRWQRRSDLDHQPADCDVRVLLVDTVGELGAWWGTAAIAFVGGSLGLRGGQNMIEPAAYGAAVSFGPHTRNFRDVVALMLAHDAAEVVQDGDQLTAFVRRCLSDDDFATSLGERARNLVAGQVGATARTVDLLEPLMDTRLAGADRRRAA